MIIFDYSCIVTNNSEIPAEYKKVLFIPVYSDSPDEFDDTKILKKLTEKYCNYHVMNFRPANEEDKKQYKGVPIGIFRSHEISDYLKFKEDYIILNYSRKYVRVYRVELCCKNLDELKKFVLENKELFTDDEFQRIWKHFNLDNHQKISNTTRNWDTNYLICRKKPTFMVVKVYHRPHHFIGKDAEEHTIYEKDDQYFKYYVRRGEKTTEIDIEFWDGYNFPLEITAVIYTWPEQKRIPEELEPCIAEWILSNVPGEAVTAWLIHVSENGRILKLAKVDQRYTMFTLDSIDPMTSHDNLIEELQDLTFGYYNDSLTIDLIKYSWLKKSGKWKNIVQKYSFIDKYVELLSDDIVTTALEVKKPEYTPDEWWTEEDVEDWLTGFIFY